MGAVSIVASTSALPESVTTLGWAVVDSSANPAAGWPVTVGDTGTVLVVMSLLTSMRTRTAEGSISTGVSCSPRASTAIRSTSWSTSIPDGWIRTRASAATTWLTTDSGPETSTLCCESSAADGSRPSGTGG